MDPPSVAWLTAAIVLLIAGQLLVAWRTFELQKSIEKERRQIGLTANLKWPRLGFVSVELINLSHLDLAVTDFSLHCLITGQKNEGKVGIHGTFALRSFQPTAIPGEIPLRELVKVFGSDNRAAAIFTVQCSVSAPHRKSQMRHLVVFEGVLERDETDNIYPVSFGIPTPPAFA